MKRVVADTNILVSALQFGGKPKRFLDLAADGQIDLAISEAIITETLRVLRDKFNRTPDWLTEADRQVRVIARLIESTESLQVVEADPRSAARSRDELHAWYRAFGYDAPSVMPSPVRMPTSCLLM